MGERVIVRLSLGILPPDQCGNSEAEFQDHGMLAALEYAAGKLISLADAETDDQEMWIIDDIERVIRAAIAKAKGE